jgi:ubiquinone/menaquinone biosynthesis C-methylase UbiE
MSAEDEFGASPDPVGHFDEVADHYAGKYYQDTARTFMTVRQLRVLELVDSLNLPAASDVLDAGCGPGYLLEALVGRGFRLSGMDGASGMLRNARARLEAARPEFPVSFEQGDIEDLPYGDASFDLVCSTGVIEYLSGDERVLREFFRVLRPGGHLILPVTNVWSPIVWLDGPVECLKRKSWFRRPFNAIWQRLGQRPILPRNFRVRLHRPGQFRASIREAGFSLVDDVYFYFLPWPRPMDQLFPGPSHSIGRRLEPLGRSPLGAIAEGYLTLSKKPNV